MKLAFSIASRFLKTNKGQTILIILGIAIGVAVQIFIGSLIDGLQNSLVDKTIGSSSHITLVPAGRDKYFDDDETLIQIFESDERFTAVAKTLDSSAFIIYDEETYPILMRGVEFEEVNDIYKFDDKLLEGRLPVSENEVILGKNLVEELELSLNEEIELITSEGIKAFIKVVGTYDLKVASVNKSWVIAQLGTVEEIFDKTNKLTSIETQIEDVFNADLIAQEYTNDIGDKLEVVNWKAQNEELLSGLVGQSASSIMIQVFVLLAVLLGITSVLAISVVQKSKQIGILKAMGIKDNTASLIFLFQGLVLGIIGSIIGAGLGIGLSYGFSNFVKNPDGSSLVPFYLDYTFVGVSIIIAIVASTIAALIPARKSSKLNPIEVIKNG